MKAGVFFTGAMLASAVWATGGTVAYVDGTSTYTGFGLREDNLTEAPPNCQTAFRFSQTETAVVLSLQAKSPLSAEELKKAAGPATYGQWPAGDCVEIFLAPPGGSGFVQFAVGPTGTMWDSRTSGKKATDFAWTLKTELTATGWKAQVTIPFAFFGAKKPDRGDKWRFNVARDFATKDKLGVSTWAAVGGVFNNPAKFADLYFSSEAELADARRAKTLKEVASLRKELAAKGLEAEFADRLAAMEKGAPAEIATEIRDEAVVIEKLKSF